LSALVAFDPVAGFCLVHSRTTKLSLRRPQWWRFSCYGGHKSNIQRLLAGEESSKAKG